MCRLEKRFRWNPHQRLLLMAIYEAMEMAGYSQGGALSTDIKRVATYFAQSSDDWRDINDMQGIDIYYISGVSRALAPARLNCHFKWNGPSHSIDSACASSSTAIHLACKAPIARESDTAVAGGGSVLPPPAVFFGCSRAGFPLFYRRLQGFWRITQMVTAVMRGSGWLFLNV